MLHMSGTHRTFQQPTNLQHFVGENISICEVNYYFH